MARLIDADLAIQKSKEPSIYDLTDFEEFINSLPTVDAEPVRYGKWIKSEIPCDEFVCSECGGACWYYDVNKTVSKSKYCPNCGAKMQEETIMPKVYISGAITGTKDYMERFAQAEKELTERGYSVINPAKVNAQLPDDTTYEEYMKMSLAMLDMCDYICMLDGWEKSNGACLEYQLWGRTLFLKKRRNKMSDELKLLDCPFCGGKAQIIRFHESWRVECTKCNAQMGYRNPAYSAVKGQLHFETKEDYIKAWNRRAESKQ